MTTATTSCPCSPARAGAPALGLATPTRPPRWCSRGSRVCGPGPRRQDQGLTPHPGPRRGDDTPRLRPRGAAPHRHGRGAQEPRPAPGARLEPGVAPDLPHLPGGQHLPRGGRLQLHQHLRPRPRRVHPVPAEAHVRVRHLRVPGDGEADHPGQGQPAFHLRRARARQAARSPTSTGMPRPSILPGGV